LSRTPVEMQARLAK